MIIPEFVSRYPNGGNYVPLEKSREIDFNRYRLIKNGEYFEKGETKGEGYYFVLEAMDENKNIYYRRLYISCTEIGAHYTFTIDNIDLNLKKYTNLYWPRLFFKDWSPYDIKNNTIENVFTYQTTENLTIITGVIDKPFGVVWTYGGPAVIFDREAYIHFRNKARY